MADDEEEGGGGGWLMSYADLMTLLFAAFVVLYGITPRGKPETIPASASVAIREAFIDIPDIIPTKAKEGSETEGKFLMKYFKATKLINPVIQRYRRYSNALPVINKDMEKVKALIKMLNEKKVSLRAKMNHTKSITVHKDPQGFKVRMLASKFFKPGEYKLSRTELPKLQKVGNFLKSLNRKVVIGGHTDNIPMTGELSNWELSALRATATLRYFVNTIRYPKEKVSAAGYADTRPIMTNDTPHGRDLNRRVEIRVLYDTVLPDEE